ncbi:DEKNAAC103029 [Brettanomyces naardenensis]|uniref:Glutathione peroxidase n=1 Tax=Brettanomyces naardenensis TaxID=13370 RepID=A0A448YMF6_BRENA|nr:DEKNAAC103029 [Brettanomyces naardenensis]
MSKFYEFTPTDNKGKPFPFADLTGKVVLVVNTASKCGFTKQYAELEQIYEKYKDQGFVIVGFPCNQFGHQEPGTAEEIENFCKVNFGVTFPLMKKIDVNGPNADPVYVWLKDEKPGLLGFKGIKWNFEKFLINPKGEVYQRYSSVKTPSGIAGDIEKLLKEVKK